MLVQWQLHRSCLLKNLKVFLRGMRCHDFSPDDTPQTTLQAGETFEPWSRTVWSIMKHSVTTIKKGIQRNQNAEKTILPHTCLLLALCACSCSANWNLWRVDFNSTLVGKLRTREHSHNVMQTRFFFCWNSGNEMQNDRWKMKLSKRTDRSYLRRQRQSENLLHRSEKRCKFGPTGGME